MPPQNRSHVPIGAVLEGKYRVTREIGRGGMAAVYEAQNVDIGKRVAVKVLAAELVTSRVVRERFIREARAAAAIRSPYICDVYDSGTYEERPFLVMELLEGDSLYDLMTRVRRLDLGTTLNITTQTCKGLSKAHEANIIHRDLKPENIFLTHNEDGGLVAKLLDFGLAKFYEPTEADSATVRLTREGALFGTPAYMSPEQAKGQGEVDHRADLWALGCIVYECLTGRTVWNVDQGVAMILAQIAGAPLPRPSRYRSDLPLGFDGWFFRALDRDAGKRFQTAKEFAESLAEVLDPGKPSTASLSVEPTPPPDLARLQAPSESEAEATDPSSSRPGSTLPPSPPESQRDPRGPLRSIAALIAVAGLALGGYAYWFYVLHPPKVASPAGVASSNDPAADSASLHRDPVEREPYALQIGSAQERLARGERRDALSMFREAFNNGGTSVARSLLAHAAVAIEAKGPCLTTGLGRPRPYDLSGPASAPSLAVSTTGPVLIWTDNHLEPTKVQTFSALLDGSLRRVSTLHGITPETTYARSIELTPVGDHFVLTYGDRSKDPGLFARSIALDGRIGGPAVRLSGSLPGQQPDPSLARAGDGTYYVIWEELQKGAVRDLVLRRLSADLRPLGPPTRLTAFRSVVGGETGVDSPHLAVTDDALHLVFALERRNRYQVMYQVIPRTDPGLAGTGVVGTSKEKDRDRHLGRLAPLNPPNKRAPLPRITCSEEGCFAVWDEDKDGALVAYIDPSRSEKLWHRAFSVRGQSPNVTSDAGVTMVAWFEQGRVRLAPLRRDGVGTASTLARVNGYQPPPALRPGTRAGEWYVAWRDYEAGHLEAFVARAQCE